MSHSRFWLVDGTTISKEDSSIPTTIGYSKENSFRWSEDKEDFFAVNLPTSVDPVDVDCVPIATVSTMVIDRLSIAADSNHFSAWVLLGLCRRMTTKTARASFSSSSGAVLTVPYSLTPGESRNFDLTTSSQNVSSVTTNDPPYLSNQVGSSIDAPRIEPLGFRFSSVDEKCRMAWTLWTEITKVNLWSDPSTNRIQTCRKWVG